MEIVELACPSVYDGDKCIAYGGNQDWFNKPWAQKAGCASVSAANMVAYYLYPNKAWQKDEFIELMQTMYERMTPRQKGYPYTYLFRQQLCAYLEETQHPLSGHVYRKLGDMWHTVKLIKNCIDHQHMVALLILNHEDPLLEDDNWHWLTITGYEEDKNNYRFILSDCGERKVIDADILFNGDERNVLRLVTFKSIL